jgi:hypothetical protein
LPIPFFCWLRAKERDLGYGMWIESHSFHWCVKCKIPARLLVVLCAVLQQKWTKNMRQIFLEKFCSFFKFFNLNF